MKKAIVCVICTVMVVLLFMGCSKEDPYADIKNSLYDQKEWGEDKEIEVIVEPLYKNEYLIICKEVVSNQMGGVEVYVCYKSKKITGGTKYEFELIKRNVYYTQEVNNDG